MKIFAIRDESISDKRDLAYLLYYEKTKTFYIEIPEDISEWDAPLILSSFVKRKEFTVNAYWSKIWVQQRIVPAERQNLGQILKDNNLDEYDEFNMLMLANGRCAQDDCYLVPIRRQVFERKFGDRFQKNVEDVLPLNKNYILIFFRDGSVRKYNMELLCRGVSRFRPILENEHIFRQVKVLTGGYGIYWNENAIISAEKLYQTGKTVPLTKEDFCMFVGYNLLGTSEVMDMLNCSRQNIEDLIRRDKLHPIKNLPKSKLFLRSEVEQRGWL